MPFCIFTASFALTIPLKLKVNGASRLISEEIEWTEEIEDNREGGRGGGALGRGDLYPLDLGTL